MLFFRAILKVCVASSAGVGMTTFSDDLAEFLRVAADWVEAGGNIQIFLGSICVIFGVWAIMDFVKLLKGREPAPKAAHPEDMLKRAAKRAAEEHERRATPPSPPLSPLPVQTENPALQDAREREAEAKARRDQADAQLRTIEHNLGYGYKTLLAALLGGDRHPDNEKEDK